MDKKQARAVYGPGWIEIIFGAGLSLVVGIIAAAVWLVFKPVVTAKEPSEAANQNTVYYLPGVSNANTGRTWMRKKQLLVEGQPGDLVLTEVELNGWAVNAMKPLSPSSTDTVVPAQINFRIADGLLQIGAPATVNLVGFAIPIVIQTRGDFQRDGEQFAFVPRELFLGSLATHRIPNFAPKVLQFIAQIQPLPADVLEGWKKLSAVAVEGEHLRVTHP